ncbi:MAG: GH36 C-terminal domain-containing protein, partial [Pirellulaceae bacterium]|nr:GH36 C-terminal domain-containing protein [Pirellulaceae bacterium]
PWTRDNKVWMAWQFDRPETGDGLIQAFRRPQAESDAHRLKLGGLDPAAQYKLTSVDGGSPVVMGGRELMANGFPVTISERPGVAVFVYQRVQ